MIIGGFMRKDNSTDCYNKKPNHFTYVTFSKEFIDKLVKEGKKYTTIRIIPKHYYPEASRTDY